MSPIAGAAQQTGQQTRQGPPASPSASALERSYIGGAGVPLRRVQTRTESNGREIITETTELPGTDGKLKMSLETRTETVRVGADSTQTKHEVFVPDAQGRPRLLETTQTDVQTSRDGSSRSVANTMCAGHQWAPRADDSRNSGDQSSFRHREADGYDDLPSGESMNRLSKANGCNKPTARSMLA